MTLKLLNEQHLEFLSLTGGCTGSYEYFHVKMPHCWQSHVVAQLCEQLYKYFQISFIVVSYLDAHV